MRSNLKTIFFGEFQLFRNYIDGQYIFPTLNLNIFTQICGDGVVKYCVRVFEILFLEMKLRES